MMEFLILFPKIPRDKLAGVPNKFLRLRFGDAFRFTVDPPNRPSQADKKRSGGSDLDDELGERVGVIDKRKVGAELPKRQVGDTPYSPTNDLGGMAVTTDPVMANRKSGRESKGQRQEAELGKSVGIEPEKAPNDPIDERQLSTVGFETEKPVA